MYKDYKKSFQNKLDKLSRNYGKYTVFSDFVKMCSISIYNVFAKNEEMEKVYNWTAEVPEWARPTVQKLLDKGYLKGNDKGELELTYSMLKMIVINDRAGLY